jgi:dihydrodipicolinate synthase/N-acetylneuraminate lyase
MSKKLYPLFGIITVLNTPFTTEDTVDLVALRRHVEVAIDAGVAGFLVPAMAAEVYKLSGTRAPLDGGNGDGEPAPGVCR